MIDYYLSDKSLNTESRIKECLDHYKDSNMSYETIYEEYDRIDAENPGPQFSDDGKNIFIIRYIV